MKVTYLATEYVYETRSNDRVGSAMGESVRLGRLDVQIPAATHLNLKAGSDSSTSKHSAIGLSHESLEMTIVNGFPVSQ